MILNHDARSVNKVREIIDYQLSNCEIQAGRKGEDYLGCQEIY